MVVKIIIGHGNATDWLKKCLFNGGDNDEKVIQFLGMEIENINYFLTFLWNFS